MARDSAGAHLHPKLDGTVAREGCAGAELGVASGNMCDLKTWRLQHVPRTLLCCYRLTLEHEAVGTTGLFLSFSRSEVCVPGTPVPNMESQGDQGPARSAGASSAALHCTPTSRPSCPCCPRARHHTRTHSLAWRAGASDEGSHPEGEPLLLSHSVLSL